MKVDLARFHIATTLLSLALLSGSEALSQSPHTGKPKVPKLWDDAAMSKLEVPLANPMGSPKHVSSDYYYRIPTRPIYKQYPVYAPGREPAGYMDRLKHLEPVIVWDDSRHKPKLKTEADWVKAGEIVFSAPILYSIDKGVFTLAEREEPPVMTTGLERIAVKARCEPKLRFTSLALWSERHPALLGGEREL